MTVERDQGKLSSMFRNILEHAKDAVNVRADDRNGLYYVKGKLAHKGDSDPILGYGDNDFDYESDPALKK